MELKVQLIRTGDEPWGFRLIGGVDFEVSLTVVKVIPNSAAEKAGLQNGDTVSSINGMTTKFMTHEDSRKALAEATDSLVLGVARGYYDPVLDDWEPYYEEIDLEDSDQPSHPTEVFTPQEFTDVPSLGLSPQGPNSGGAPYLGDPNLARPPYGQPLPQSLTGTPFDQSGSLNFNQSRGVTPFDSKGASLSRGTTPYDQRLGTPGRDLNVCRSLTGSPFVLPSKPYRPFSTEPVDKIPPLEDPIILNPTYKDVFPDFGIDEDLLPKTKFKLPISEQYDPDGTRRLKTQNKTESKTDSITEIKTETKSSHSTQIQTTTEIKEDKKTESSVSEVKEQKKKEEVTFTDKLKQDVDFTNIAVTASSIVDESIQRAVVVAEDIKKEIDVELLETDKKVDTSVVTEQKLAKVDEVVYSTDNTTEKLMRQEEKKAELSQKRVKVSEKIEALKESDKESVKAIEERKESIKHEIVDVVETGSVKQKSTLFEKEVEKLSESNIVKTADVTKVDAKSYQKKDVKQKAVKTDVKDTSSVKSESKTEKMSTSRLLAEQRAYIIGLQTIPNIRGSIHSSYHYNLLLKTFFIHLTDVMVALSRFILSEPVLNKEESTDNDETIETTKREVGSYTEDVVEKEDITKNLKKEELKDKVAEVERIHEAEIKPDVKEMQITARAEDIIETESEKTQGIQETEHTVAEDIIETASVKTQRIQETKHTAAVIEKVKEQIKKESIEDKGDIEVEQSVSHHKVSGSKMAQRVEKKSEELIQTMDSVIHEFQTKASIEETSSASLETKEIQEVSEQQSKRKGKNTYVAVVESHTYTNKDAILEEFLSGLSSLQSPEETRTAVQTLDAVSYETVSETSKAVELAKAVIEAAEEKIAEIHEEAHTAEQNYHESKEIMQSSTEVVQELQKVEDYKQTEDFLATERKEMIEYEKLHNEVVAEVKQELKAVEEQSEVVAVEEQCEVVTLKRPQTLALNLDEDPHIVKKKFEIDISETKNSVAMIEDLIKDEEKAVIKTEIIEMHEDPHIVKKISEIEQEKSIETKSEVKEDVSTIIKVEETAEIKTEIIDMHEDPHIVKKKLEIEREKFIETKSEVKEDVSTILKGEETALKIQSETSESKVSISQAESSFQSFRSTQIEQKEEFSSVEQKHIEQESSFIAKSVQKSHDLTVNTQIAQESIQSQSTTAQSIKTEDITQITEVSPTEKVIENGIETPVVPPTPLTDEYMFNLSIPLPRGITPVPPDPSPEAEPLSGKDLIAHIDTKLDSPILYDPPLPTPPGSKVTSPAGSKITSPVRSKVTSPVYTKPGLRGGADKPEYRKEEIMEIERKSSLLATAIDETIKSIEEYKEEVGLKKAREESDVNVEVKIATNFDSKTSSQQWCIVEQKVTNITNDDLASTAEVKIPEPTNELSGRSEINIINTGVNANGDLASTTEVKVPEATNEESRGTEIKNPNSELNLEENGTSIDIEDIKSHVAKLITTEPKEQGDPLERYRPVKFDPEEIQNAKLNLRNTNGIPVQPALTPTREMYRTETGEPLGTHQGIVDGLEEAVVEPEVAKELGKPGMTEEKIAELISGEAEMLREAHVMGLSRVIKSHMHRANDDSSVDFKKIKPIITSLKDSEVLKALNDEVLEEMMREKEKKKKEEKKWTTFLQKPQRPVPKAKFGYHGYVDAKEEVEKPYKVQIVKQPKPKVAPDYKPKDFNTGLLPWEERALREPTPPPVEREEPLLIPEEPPEILEAVDPLPESEVPDLEDSGIPLPDPEPEKELEDERSETQEEEEAVEDLDLEAIVEETEKIVEEKLVEEMEQNNLAEQLISNVQSMVDPNAPLEQQLAQMRAQIAALAQLPCVIQQSLDLVTKQLSQLSTKEVKQSTETTEVVETSHSEETTVVEPETEEMMEKEVKIEEESETTAVVEEKDSTEVSAEVKTQEAETAEEIEKMKKVEAEMMEEQKRLEKQKKELDQMRLDQEGRQLKQRPTPRVGKPKPVFGPAEPMERPLVLPRGEEMEESQGCLHRGDV